MNPWTTHPLLRPGLTLILCLLPAWVLGASPSSDTGGDAGRPKALSGSFVAFDPSAGQSVCWAPETNQTFCFRAESFTDDSEYVRDLWLLLPTDWAVTAVTVAGSPSCDSGDIGPFSWSFHTPSYEVDIDHRRYMEPADHCTVHYCVEATTGAGGGDAAVSWYWDGDGFGAEPHWPCSDDGYTPAGESLCDESVMPRAAIPDCSIFGSIGGTIRDAFTSGPTCTTAKASIEPGGLVEPADGAGDYGPVFLADGSYDVTGIATGYDEITATSVSVTGGVTTTQDFNLLRPVLDSVPTSFNTTVPTGGSTDETLTLNNLGFVPPLDWSLRELPPTETMNPLSRQTTAGPVRIEAELENQMRMRGEGGYLIDFRERPDLSPALSMSWGERGRFVVDELTETAERTQARVRSYLDERKVAYQPFWIDNMIVVSFSTREVFDGLLEFEEIEILRARRILHLIDPVERSPSGSEGRAVEANIAHVLADQAWALGFDGSGMVVSNIDSGVRYNHEALEPHYRGNLGGGAFNHDYNWLDGHSSPNTVPTDGFGHGSQTMGIMVGDDGGGNQIGMAPGASWIACDACGSGSCSFDALLICAQWIVAPYPVGNPSAPDPSKRPHVVNNSWGDCGNSYDDWFQGSIDSWHAAGIYPVFANGNASNCGYSYPPGCNTVGNPARYGNVTGVGSTGTSDGVYASHSNWGPTDNSDTVNPNGYPSLKPQVVAPGVSIRSSYISSDTNYELQSGTSMSAPHVSGLVALMWQAAPCLIGDYARTEDIIQDSAVAIPYASGCGDDGPGNVPNMATGWGEINALEAVIEATVYCDADWLPWVSKTPTSGQIATGGSQEVTLSFTCGASPGDESGTLRLTSGDPCAETTEIPLTLHCGTTESVDLAISKTDGATTSVPGAGIEYTIVVTNAGPDGAVGATVMDGFPAALTGVSWSCSASAGASCTSSGSGDIADTVTVPVGGSLAYTATAVIDGGATGTLSNTATVVVPSGVTDLDSGNNSATDNSTLETSIFRDGFEGGSTGAWSNTIP